VVSIRKREATPRETKAGSKARKNSKDATMEERAAMDQNTRMGRAAYGPML
jgi:hypothetical protein